MQVNVGIEQVMAASSYIQREWGDYGYRIETVESPTHAVSLFHVRHLDCRRFVIAADKWGNTGGPVDSHGYATPERTEALAELVGHDAKATGVDLPARMDTSEPKSETTCRPSPLD